MNKELDITQTNGINLTEDSEPHWQVVERILFIYSKLNPGIKYVQVYIKFKII